MISFRELVRRRYVRGGVIVFAVATAVLGSGVAYAAWTSSGTGAATTKAGTAQAPVVTGGAVVTGTLYPGGTGDAVVNVSNPNPYPVTITSIAPTGTPTCGVTFAERFPGTQLAANSAPVAITFSVAMALSAPNTCQGAVIDVPVVVTIASGTGA
ncbi:hypothetical protein [Lentzea sp. NBRC 102530]|uniref:hypothetical protein n=1 Tax=Lentzea sp. NBRC 102530 TaxID=3032201 RepID=UPI0024A0B4A5|nr:hypothetical protein [Lentzea sp. NBRC 102530]GLY49738.1 hypothetical protein Lesp01_33940 [Lentzea sp. NBRC 102530]